MSDEKKNKEAKELKKAKEVIYEIYTASGNRVTVKGADIVADYQASDLSIYDKDGECVGQFELMNIEGWRIAP